jgi:hypothetical protein
MCEVSRERPENFQKPIEREAEARSIASDNPIWPKSKGLERFKVKWTGS